MPWMVPGGTNYSAVDSPGGPLLGGTNYSMTGVPFHDLYREILYTRQYFARLVTVQLATVIVFVNLSEQNSFSAETRYPDTVLPCTSGAVPQVLC